MKPSLSRALAAALLATSGAALAADIDVMTQNQYVGANLAPVVAAALGGDPDAINTAVVDALRKVAATRPAARARVLALEIALRHPDVVGLQEAYAITCEPYPAPPAPPPQPGMGCDDPSIKAAFSDHLRDTERALFGQYVVAGRVTNLQTPLIPFTINRFPAMVRVVDRDAILVRKGLPAKAVDFVPTGFCTKPSDQGCNYRTAPDPFQTPVGQLAVERGFLAVDLTVEGRAYRVFNTHLEERLLSEIPGTQLLQVGQAYELLGTAFNTWDGVKRVIVIGDFNSAPGDTIPIPPYPATLPWAPSLPVIPPYQVFVGSGFTDAWLLRAHAWPDYAGLSCCQAADLLNRKSQLYERIDLIFSLTPPTSVSAMLLGDELFYKLLLPTGQGNLWPSDHAAVAAKLVFDY